MRTALARLLIPGSIGALALLGVLYRRAGGLRAAFRRDLAAELARPAAPALLIGEPDLEPLPPAVQRWMRRAGVVGQPRVANFHARFRGWIRQGPDAEWMGGPVEQYTFLRPAVRLFFMDLRRAGLPVRAYHRYAGGRATMEARLLGVLPVMKGADDPRLVQGETVTFLNDIFLLAPGALVDLPIGWEVLDDHQVRATFENAGCRVSAVLTFDEAGDLRDFRSSDRHQSDGRSYRLLDWSTPVSEYRDFSGVRLPAGGEARWHDPAGVWTYARLDIEDVRYNIAAAPPG